VNGIGGGNAAGELKGWVIVFLRRRQPPFILIVSIIRRQKTAGPAGHYLHYD
jgi:hypothetical protein